VVHQTLDHGQSEPRPLEFARHGAVRLGERFKHALLLFVGNANARIGDGDPQEDRIPRRAVHNGTRKAHGTNLGEFDRIRHEMDKNVAEPLRIAKEDFGAANIGFQSKQQSGPMGLSLEGGLDPTQDEVWSARRTDYPGLTAFRAGILQDIVDDAEQPATGLQGRGHVIGLLGFQGGGLQELEHAEHPV